MKLFFTEHNHDADNLANMEEHEHKIAEGFKKIAVEVDSNIQRWEGELWQETGRSGCGITIEETDKNKWIILSKIGVPFEMCSALSLEVAVVCNLVDVLNLIFRAIVSKNSDM